MAMPRPTGKPLEVAKKVVPGLEGYKPPKEKPRPQIFSEVEIEQTNNIENREGLR